MGRLVAFALLLLEHLLICIEEPVRVRLWFDTPHACYEMGTFPDLRSLVVSSG